MSQAGSNHITGATVIEPFAVQDTFCAQIVHIERLGAVSRIFFAAPNRDMHTGEEVLYVVAKLIVPTDLIATMIYDLGQAPEERAATVEQRRGSIALIHNADKPN